MDFKLDDIEARVLGCLIEKAFTTPDVYPLTLNALTHACSQKHNRHPVATYEETAVVRALERLKARGLMVRSEGDGSLVPKYHHILPERLPLDEGELAIVCELLIRGPQTPGELNGRVARMVRFDNLEALKSTLSDLETRPDPVVMPLPREAGRKEIRHAHLLCGEPDVDTAPAEVAPEAATLVVRAENTRIAALEAEVATLRTELDEIGREFARFRAQFD